MFSRPSANGTVTLQHMAIYIAPTKVYTKRAGDRAEKKVIDKLRSAQSDERTDGWMAFSSKILPNHTNHRFGEADLILIAPNFNSIIVVEVKSHKALFLSESKEEVKVFTNGKRVNASEQLKNNFITVREDLKEFKTKGQLSDAEFYICSCIVAPEAICNNNEGLSWRRNQIIDKEDFERDFVGSIISIVQYTKNRERHRRYRNKMNNAIANQLKNIIESEPRFQVTNASIIQDSQQEIIELTSDQNKITKEIINNIDIPVLVDGCAGSGKTIVALNIANEIATAQRKGKILFTCYNNLLAEHISNNGYRNFENIEISAVNALMSEYITEFNKDLDIPNSIKEDFNNLRREIRDRHLLRKMQAGFCAKHGNFEKYIALIIDEYPDMMDKYTIEFLDSILQGGFSDGKWCAFGDLAQDILAKTNSKFQTLLGEISAKEIKVYQKEMMENIRNSRQISEMSSRVIQRVKRISDRGEIKSLRAESWPIEIKSYQNDDELIKQIDKQIKLWISRGFSEKDITVIHPVNRLGELRNKLKSIESENIVFTPISDLINPKFGYTTAKQFKGCENEVIIIVDPENLLGSKRNSSEVNEEEIALAYVAITRAKIGLTLLYDENREIKYLNLLNEK
ncbi:NERD domain-containing protein [Deinococcus aquaticus]|uniref:NERD domain-containing protein n=2 Tax=Deinococcus aquaticus TaxID=328692 RepID=UPI00360AA788